MSPRLKLSVLNGDVPSKVPQINSIRYYEMNGGSLAYNYSLRPNYYYKWQLKGVESKKGIFFTINFDFFAESRITFYALSPGNNGFSLRGSDKSATFSQPSGHQRSKLFWK